MLLDVAIKMPRVAADFFFFFFGPVYEHRKNSLALWGMKKNKLEWG